MTVKQIERHEKKNRKGQSMGKGWREDFDAMARKTVIRRLCGKYGLMSITYQNGDAQTMQLAQSVMEEEPAGSEIILDPAPEEAPAGEGVPG